jgi:hypothetical protein
MEAQTEDSFLMVLVAQSLDFPSLGQLTIFGVPKILGRINIPQKEDAFVVLSK